MTNMHVSPTRRSRGGWRRAWRSASGTSRSPRKSSCSILKKTLANPRGGGGMKKKSGGVSRRDFLKSSALAGAAAATGGGALTANVVHASEKSRRRRKRGSLVLVNGRIHTMDPKNPIVSSIAIRNGRFVAVGHGASGAGGGPVINLRGATVIPGLIESHTHFVSLANRPGYHVAHWELANNVAEVLDALRARRAQNDVPAGAFITAMGAGVPNIWRERRMPTFEELSNAV